MDRIPPEKRRALMSKIKGVNTAPEMIVRRLVFSKGYRYRLHRKNLPGRPDLVFPSRKSVIFVHGCFWHQHTRCNKATTPKTRTAFWTKKLSRNVERDIEIVKALTSLGWRVLTIWECETKEPERLTGRISEFLERG
ncbi:MAG: very short patch repair endonuclease [Roseibium sp.]